MILRLLQAKRRCKKENRAMLPKDLFHLKGFMVAGTDNLCYKDDLEELWGIRPMELFAGTEPSIMGTETWTRKGMYFFPDTAFYEFITEKDMMRNYEDPSYIPPTYLMDEVRPGEKYELVQTVSAGEVCAVTGLEGTYPGQGIGAQKESLLPVLEPVMTYRIELPDGCDAHKMFQNLRLCSQYCLFLL